MIPRIGAHCGCLVIVDRAVFHPISLAPRAVVCSSGGVDVNDSLESNCHHRVDRCRQESLNQGQKVGYSVRDHLMALGEVPAAEHRECADQKRPVWMADFVDSIS